MPFAGRLPASVGRVTLAALVGVGAGCASAPGPRGAAPDHPLPTHTSGRIALASGWRDTTPINDAASIQNAVLRPGAVLHWSLESATARPSRSMAGRAVVGPDGTIEVGPYGTVHVAGLTVGQAKTALTDNLSLYLVTPLVRLVPEGDWVTQR